MSAVIMSAVIAEKTGHNRHIDLPFHVGGLYCLQSYRFADTFSTTNGGGRTSWWPSIRATPYLSSAVRAVPRTSPKRSTPGIGQRVGPRAAPLPTFCVGV
jgi:hypothetical protein